MVTIRQRFDVRYEYPVTFTRDVFKVMNPCLEEVLAHTGSPINRILTVIDSGVMDKTPGLLERIDAYGKAHRDRIDFVAPPSVMRGGEVCKRDTGEVEKVLALIDKHQVCRHSFVLAIGGGAVLDAAGYAAAIAHRGIRLIRMPTTVLAQNDSGVGVKSGVNGYGRKNFLGTFTPPYAVINDFDFLKTLPERDLRGGIAEAIKVALIKDRAFFDFLYAAKERLASFAREEMERMIIRCAELHIDHIGKSGDPFEFGSARPLDYGHWSAHKIEELTHGEVRHGEAVAMGMAIDSLYSFHMGFINQIELQKILGLLEDIGFCLYHWSLGWMNIDKALGEFQQHLGGELTIPLLDGIGRSREVHEVDTGLYRKCIETLSKRRRAESANEGTDPSSVCPGRGEQRFPREPSQAPGGRGLSGPCGQDREPRGREG